jgi:hypothetical protein
LHQSAQAPASERHFGGDRPKTVSVFGMVLIPVVIIERKKQELAKKELHINIINIISIFAHYIDYFLFYVRKTSFTTDYKKNG